MRRIGLGLLLVVAAVACSGGEAASTIIDDRSPPFQNREISLFWSTRDDDPPADQWINDTILEFRLPILLLPSEPPGGGEARIFLRISNLSADRFVTTSINTDGFPWLKVTTTNRTGQIGCGSEQAPAQIRGTDGCRGMEGPGSFLLSWEEGGWVHQARWTQSITAGSDQYFGFFLDWLSRWTAYP